MTKTRTITATSIIPLLPLATAGGTPTANPESAAPQTKTQTQTKTEKKPAPEPKKETPAEEKPEEQTPTAPEPATDPTSGEWTETMNSPSDLSGQLDEAWLRCSPQNNPTPELFSWKRSLNHDGYGCTSRKAEWTDLSSKPVWTVCSVELSRNRPANGRKWI